MIKVEVKSAEITTKSGVSAKSGKPYTIREQEAYAHCLGRDGNPLPYPVRIRISLRDEQKPYEPGDYTIAPSSVFVDRFDQLSLSVQLIPIATAYKKAA